ncbi:MAG: biotin/lipoyl-containing protein [Acidobacteriota bacterium]
MRRYHIAVGGRTHVIEVTETDPQNFIVGVEGQEFTVTLSASEDVAEAVITPEIATALDDDRSERSPVAVPSAAAFRPVAPQTLPPLRPATPRPLAPPPASDDANVKAPMPGTITAVDVRPGDEVQAGQVLVKLEAMKMVNAIRSPHAGIVSEVRVQVGDSVGHGYVLVTFEGAR